ncbi:MAG: DUF1553 domain-containing protein [Pirellulales bacterium]|nr:DUF1553 domain-containing protein [Pirellulales bacterium]
MRNSWWLIVVIGVACTVQVHVLRAAENSTSATSVERTITPGERDHWAYHPMSHPAPPDIDDERWSRHPVDRFVKAAMDEAGVESLPQAGRAALLRRLSFDLTGLPPTPAELDAFLADPSPDAYEKQVERLLASPAYGERWAQHWLDLARFAETDGFEHDLLRPNAWRYRDWVIDALNRDLPYDQFVREQLAGDLLRPDDPAAAVATGFLLCGPDMPDINLQEERRHVVLNEMTATVGSTLLALQFGCAQCHDHKWDAITQHDFYHLRAYFESVDIFRDHPIPTAEERAAREAAETAWAPEDHQRDKRRRELEDTARRLFREKNPDERPTLEQALAELKEKDRTEHAELVEVVAKLPVLPELPMGRVVRDGKHRAGHLYLRGDFRQEGPELACRLPQVLASAEEKDSTVEADSENDAIPSRVALAAWITRGEHPLTARVMVNRLWQWHFGLGLAASSSDFGVMGSTPTHPELLDWLARRFVADGWGMKAMHRLLVTSKTYQLASGPYDANWSAEETHAAQEIFARSSAADPDNKWLWRRRRVRLDGESIRDAMLAVSGNLSDRRGGPGIRPPLPPEVTVTLLKDQWNISGDSDDHRRRSIYLFVRRNLRYPLFDVFDRPDTNASCAMRHESTTATQSLMLFNSEFSLQCAQWLAGELVRAAPDDVEQQIGGAYQRILNRVPTAEEVEQAQLFLSQQTDRLRSEGRTAAELALPVDIDASLCENPYAAAALVDFALALFNANEFVYLD